MRVDSIKYLECVIEKRLLVVRKYRSEIFEDIKRLGSLTREPSISRHLNRDMAIE